MFRTILFGALLCSPQHAFGFGLRLLDGATLTGILLETTIHESGHALTALAVGWEVDQFRPYPHICGGRLVGGCVSTHTDLKPYGDDGKMNRKYLAENRAISAAGSLASQLGVLIFSPLVGKLKASTFWGKALRQMLFFQNMDWLFYTVTDSVSNFQGDWYSVAKSLDVPTYTFVPPAALSAAGLNIYRQKFVGNSSKQNGETSQIRVAPHITYLGTGQSMPTLGIKLALKF